MYRPRQQYEYPPQQGFQQHAPEHPNGPQAQQQPQSGYQPQRSLYNNPNAFGQPQQTPQQQYQPPQQQQQGQNVANGAGGGANGSASGDAQSQANSGPAGQEMNLASVLHYLQSEWRRWERDRNEWEIERAEMRARIALLEGQRRSAENLKVDLLRRVKMLEYALRQERTKTVSTVGKSTVAPSRLSTLQDEDKMRDEKEGSGSEGSEEGNRPKANGNGIHPAAISNAGTMASRTSDSPWKSIGAASKDPKARARSREYLKQCLQEITYLTSPGALNPLPARPPAALEIDPSQPSGQSPSSLDPESKIPDRPRKTIPDINPPPSIFPKDLTAPPAAPGPAPDKSDLPNPAADQAISSSSSATVPPPQITTSPSAPSSESASSPAPSSLPPKSEPNPSSLGIGIDPSARPPSSPATHTVGLPLDDSEAEPESPQSSGSGEEAQLLTAIYRPESKAAWREELRAANEQAEKARKRSTSVSSSTASEPGQPSDEEQLQSLTLSVPDEEVERGSEESQVEKSWTSRKVLKSHLDVVRAVAFAQGPGIMLASAGDDCTVKVWYMDAGSIMSPKPNSNELEPIMTYRTHSAPITSLAISSPLSTIFSASLDSTILAWRLPQPSSDAYAPHDTANLLQTLEGHTDAVWDLCLVPSRSSPSGIDTVKGGSKKQKPDVPKSLLVSASADGTVKVWECSRDARQWTLKRSVSFGEGASPTCLGAFAVEAGKVLVGFTDGRVGLVDVEDGGDVMYFGEASEGGSKQVNAVLCHPTWPVVLLGSEDGYIRFFHAGTRTSSSPPSPLAVADTPAGPTPYHEILAHPSAITSLTLSPLHPHGLLSAASDCSIRVWDLEKKTSVQDCAGHRQRAGEGVVGLTRHPELPVVASAGADGVVRVWSAA